MLNSKERYSV